jgi:GNAT superfamily N-acetyltransferase
LLPADAARLEEILDGTYPVWGEGLSRHAYGAWNRGQMATDWGRKHLSRVALIDGDTLLASAKRYDFHAVVGGRRVPVLGIGAVFTPESRRGQGHAQALLNAMIDDAVSRGCEYALLFSEIGAAYYERAGFRALPRTLATIDVAPPVNRGAPATFVRSGELRDLPFIAAISARYRDGAGFALDRSSDWIAFAMTRRRLLAGFSPAGVRQAEFFVAEEGHRPVAYVFVSRGPRGVVLEECGDYDPSGARIGAMLQVLAARAPADPALRLNGWLPSSIRPSQLSVKEDIAPAEIMMIRPLQPLASSMPAVTPVVYWQTDVFRQSQARFFRRSSFTVCAASQPGNPVRPPPGCVPALPRYKPRMGVR